MLKEILPEPYGDLLARIGDLLTTGRRQIYQTVNTTLLKTYWEIGRHIVEFEQGGSHKAEFGTALLARLSKDLTQLYGKGFSRSNVNYMRLLFKRYEVVQTLSVQLHWAHYCEILKLDDDLERNFYHRILKCFVVIDLKRGIADHGDVGQMNMYLNYFKNEESAPDDNEPIGIILATNKSNLAIEYALGGLSNQIFVTRYQLYLPSRALLEEKLRLLLEA